MCVCPCLGGRSPNIATPDQILQKTYHSMPALNKLIDQLQKKGAEIELYEDDRVVETEFLKKYH